MNEKIIGLLSAFCIHVALQVPVSRTCTFIPTVLTRNYLYCTCPVMYSTWTTLQAVDGWLRTVQVKISCFENTYSTN